MAADNFPFRKNSIEKNQSCLVFYISNEILRSLDLNLQNYADSILFGQSLYNNGMSDLDENKIDEAIDILDGNDRRVSPRKSIDTPFKFINIDKSGSFIDDDGRVDEEARAINISKVGVAIESKIAMNIGDVFYGQIMGLFIVKLKNHRFIRGTSGRYIYGCEFLKIFKEGEKEQV